MVLFREGVALSLGAERGVLLGREVRGVVLLLEREVLLRPGCMSVFQISTNISTVEACLVCISLLRVDLDQSKLSRE